MEAAPKKAHGTAETGRPHPVKKQTAPPVGAGGKRALSRPAENTL